MCIICNLPPESPVGHAFLDAFNQSRLAMKAAADKMLEASQVASAHGENYARAHKRMVKLIREWNRIEQEREQTP